MVKIRKNSVKVAGMVALLCLSLASFTYINSIQFPSDPAQAPNTYVEEIEPEAPEVLPDVELVKRLVRKAFEFMSKTNF